MEYPIYKPFQRASWVRELEFAYSFRLMSANGVIPF